MRVSLKNYDEVTHVWASQSQKQGYCGHLQFMDANLWSYNQRIARILKNEDGTPRAALFDFPYSGSTAMHRNLAIGAVTHLPQFCAPDICDLTPEAMRAAWVHSVEVSAAEYQAATRKPSRAKHLRELREHVAEANALCAFFGLEPFTVPVEVDSELAAWIAHQATAVAARDAAVNAKRDTDFAEHRATALAALPRWLSGERASIPFSGLLRETDGSYLRLRDGWVETTGNARVPVDDVRAAASLLLRLVRRERAWENPTKAYATKAELRQFKVGSFTVDRIDADGTLHVGCHVFRRTELERFATVLGV